MCWCGQRKCSVYFPPNSPFLACSPHFFFKHVSYRYLLIHFTLKNIYKPVSKMSNMRPNILHICNKLLYVAFKHSLHIACCHVLWHGLHVIAFLLNINAPCVQNEHCVALRTDTCVSNESSLRRLASGTDVHGFHISPCLSSWYLFIYVYVSVYCVAPSSGAHTPACQKKKQENEIKCMYPACLPSFISAVTVSMTPWEPLN